MASNVSLHDIPTGPLDHCQICNSFNLLPVLNLGHHAPCDSLLTQNQLCERENTYPLNLVRCYDCGLVQIDYAVAPEELFFPEYPYRSGITETLLNEISGSTFLNFEKLRVACTFLSLRSIIGECKYESVNGSKSTPSPVA